MYAKGSHMGEAVVNLHHSQTSSSPDKINRRSRGSKDSKRRSRNEKIFDSTALSNSDPRKLSHTDSEAAFIEKLKMSGSQIYVTTAPRFPIASLQSPRSRVRALTHDDSTMPNPLTPRKVHRAVRDYTPIDTTEIGFRQGDDIVITDVDDSGWAEGYVLPRKNSITKEVTSLDSPRGWFPSDFSDMPSPKDKGSEIVKQHSIIDKRWRTSKRLESFFGRRPDVSELSDKNILPSGGANVSPQVAAAQKELETKHKKNVLGMFFKTSLLSSNARKAQRRSVILSSDGPKGENGTIFGIDFTHVVSQEGHTWPVPYPIVQFAEYIKAHGINHEGLFRLSGNFVEETALRDHFKTGLETLDLSVYGINTVASVFKAYLRTLPNCLIPWEAAEELKSASEMTDQKARQKQMHDIMMGLPLPNQMFLDYLFDFLRDVSHHSEQNKMTAANLAIVFTPSLIKPKIMTVENLTNQSLVQIVCLFIEMGSIQFWSETAPDGPSSTEEANATA